MSTGRPIVVVDDSLTMRRLLELILTRSGRTVRCFETATDALAHVPALRPSLLLIDAMLPDMDGAALRAALAERLGDALPPVIFVSGLDRDELPAADGYVRKPFTPDQVLATIADVESAR